MRIRKPLPFRLEGRSLGMSESVDAIESQLIAVLSDLLSTRLGEDCDVAAIPRSMPMADLPFARELDSIDILEIVVQVEDEFDCELTLPESSQEWSAYTWGNFLDDLGAAIVAARKNRGALLPAKSNRP